MISLEDVEFGYRGNQVFGGLSADLGPGAVGLVGINGAGKTTLLRLLATVTRPDAGSLTIEGLDPVRRVDRHRLRQRLGYLPQDASWSAGFTVRELCYYFAWLQGVPRRQRADSVDTAIAAARLTKQAGARLGSLSGGQRRRAMIARALVHNPSVLILDEPTTGLDPEQRVFFRRVVRDLKADRTLILSTHLIEDVAHVADQVAVLHEGTFQFLGDTDELADLAADDDVGDSPLERGFHRVISEGVSS